MSTEMAVFVPAPTSSLRSRFQTGVTYNAIGAVFNQGSTFAVNIIVANLLGRQVFGQYAIIQSTFATLALVAQLSTGITATKYVAEFRSTDPERAGRILGMLAAFSAAIGTIVAVALWCLSGWIAVAVLHSPTVAADLEIGCAVVLFAVLNGLLMGALAGLEGYRRLSAALILSGLAYTAICAFLAIQGGLRGAVSGLAISGCAQFLFLWVALRKECRRQNIHVCFTRIEQERAILLRFALPGALSGFTSMPALWAASALLVRQPAGYSQMAIYSAAYSLMTAVLFLPSIANNVGTSLINHHRSLGSHGYREAFWANLAISLVVVTLGAAAVALAGPELLRLFGKDFKDGYSVLMILLVATVVQTCAIAIYQVIQSEARMWLSFFVVALPRDLLLVLLAYILIPAYGARGVAIAYVSAWVIAAVAITCVALKLGIARKTSAVLLPQ